MPSGQSGTREHFEAVAQAIWDGLPEQFRAALGNVTVHVADFADAETLKAMHIRDPYDLLGLYHGVGLPFKSVWIRQVCPTGSFSTASPSSVTPTETVSQWTASSATC